MKRILLASAFAFSLLPAFASGDNPVIMTINGKNIHKSEFEYIWQKNRNVSVDTLTVRDYADMFALFKMKVAAAEDAGIDTTKAFIDEFNGYRSQLTPEYMKDAESELKVLEEAYKMSLTYSEASHIMISVGQHADPSDTLKAYNLILDIRKKALKKNADFASLARQYSQDGSKDNGGHLGTNITSRFIYPFAKTMMQLGEGEISQPFRTAYGYHIIKLHKRFEAPGQYVAAHIFKQAPSHADQTAREQAHKEIMAIYDELQAGGDFIKTATSNRNDDQYPKTHDGLYPALSPGQMPYEYEQAVFSIEDGTYSAPFSSDYGWHIVKRISVNPISMDAMEKDLKTLVSRDERSNAGRTGLANRLRKEYGYALNEQAFNDFCEAVVAYGHIDNHLQEAVTGMPDLASFKDNAITATEFAEYLQKGKFYIHYLKEPWNAFVNERILAYEDTQLEKKYPDFGNLMQEYHDGLLLFEISSREVWNKPNSDTEGLCSYFDANKDKYTWDKPRYKGAVIYCADRKQAPKVKKTAAKLPSDSLSVVLKRTYNTDTTTMVKVERGLYKPGDNPAVDKLAFKQGEWMPDETFQTVWLKGKVLRAPEELNDVRGSVTTDYQQFLEQEWIKRLREKYPVTINEEVLNSIK